MSEELLNPLRVFLPKLSSIKIETRMHSMFPAFLNDSLSVSLNDGISTNLRYKGDGIKSLFALAILKDRKVSSGASVIAIEEPESHLHSGAIHDLVNILTKMSENSQVIITTHNPLFVRQNSIASNIIVNNGSARPAKRISEIREVLGVWPSDNLRNAQYVLVVEGENDKVVLLKVLPVMSDKIKQALSSNLLVIKPLIGVGNLTHDLGDLKNQMCKYIVLVDNDEAGKNALNKAKEAGFLLDSEYRLTNCNGLSESEIEDCIKQSIYSRAILEEFSVDVCCKEFDGKQKWSDRMKNVFLSKGLLWNSEQEKR